MSNQQLKIISQLNSPFSGGIEGKGLERREGVRGILIDENLVAIVPNGQILVVVADGERHNGDVVGFDRLVSRIFI